MIMKLTNVSAAVKFGALTGRLRTSGTTAGITNNVDRGTTVAHGIVLIRDIL
jgi:hypothetical protein